MKKLISLVLSCMIILCSIPIVSAGAEETAVSSTDSNANANVGSMSVTSTNSFGDLLSNEFEESKQLEDSATNAVLGCKIEGNIASIKVANSKDCKIVVSIYDEETNNMVASGMEEIEMYAENVLVELDEEFLPEFYLVKVFMLDKNNKPLAEAYECDRYTKSYQEFLAKTVDDFEGKNVLQLDENDKSNNFGVYEDYVKIIPSSNKNIYSVENSTDNTYFFENVNEDISSLQVGDIVSYTCNGEELIFKVKTITIENSTATIERDESLVIDDVFSYLKINSEPEISSPAKYNARKSRSLDVDFETDKIPGVEFSSSIDNGNKSISLGIKFNSAEFEHGAGNERIKLEYKGKASGSATVKLTNTSCFEIDDENGERNYSDIGIEVDFSSSLEFSSEFNAKVSLLDIPDVALGSTGLMFDFKIDFVFKSSVEASINKTQKTQICITHNSKTNVTDFSDYLLSQSEDSVEFEGEFFIGIVVSPSINFLKKVAEISLSAETGIKMTGALITEFYEGHKCKYCIDGEIYFIIEPSLDIKVVGFKWTITYDKLNFETKICDWFVSDKYDFAFSICPDLLINDDYMGTVEPVSVVTHDKGKCGEKVRYVYDKGTLKIHGTGPMYAQSCRFWEKYKDSIYSVEIDEGITTLGTEAFKNCSNLKTIILPNTLEDIGYYSFNNCSNLREIKIPYGVKNIGTGAFAGCSIITSLTIPETVKTIGSNLCSNCVLLEEIVLPSKVESFDTAGAFAGCIELNNITFPNGIKTIGAYACSGCTELETVIVPEGVTDLGLCSFDMCKSMRSITLPSTLQTVGDFAFMFTATYGLCIYYNGTAEQWSEVVIRSYNGALISAKKEFSGEFVQISNVSSVLGANSKRLSSFNSSAISTYLDKDIVRTELVPNSYYVVMILKGTLDNYTVDNDSLLYIDGAYSDNDGTVGFDVYYEDTDEDTIAVVFGECNHEYGDTEVVQEPSQSSEGLQGQICSKCGDITNETIIERLSSNVYIDGELVYTGVRFTFPTSDKEGFIAYTDGEKYFDSEDVYVLSKDINISTVSIDKPKMLKGASMRLNEVQGLRFYTEVDIQKINELKDLGFNIKLGMLIAPVDLVGTNDLTFDIDVANYVNVVYDSSEYYTEGDFKGIVGSLANIKDKNATRNFVARGYITVENENVSKTIYADYDAGDINNNTRSIGYVANCVQKDFEFYNTLTDFHKEIVDKYANLYNQVKYDPFGFDTW